MFEEERNCAKGGEGLFCWVVNAAAPSEVAVVEDRRGRSLRKKDSVEVVVEGAEGDIRMSTEYHCFARRRGRDCGKIFRQEFEEYVGIVYRQSGFVKSKVTICYLSNHALCVRNFKLQHNFSTCWDSDDAIIRPKTLSNHADP